MKNWIKSLFSKKPQACNDNRIQYEDMDDDCMFYIRRNFLFVQGHPPETFKSAEKSDPNDWSAKGNYVYWDKD